MTVVIVLLLVVLAAWATFLIFGLTQSESSTPRKPANRSTGSSVGNSIDDTARLKAEAAVLVQRQAEDRVATQLAFGEALKAHREGRK